jgi:iron complex outermembrane receptor protein
MINYKRHFSVLLAPMILAVTCIGGALFAPDAAAQEKRGSASILLEEIVVTARKREELAQDVPLAITAFSADQIESLKIRDLMNMAVAMPNVALDDIGTFRGSANFSIRGLGINSSIPSIDPTVGVFLDGVYLGNNVGTIFDMFDVESVTVLRGPQGILFGRNVTGGAILINTKKPGDVFETSVRAAVDGGGDGGQNRYLMGSIGGPVSDTLGIKLSAYYNDDDGWFENQFDGSDFGAIQQTMVRPVMVWTPTDKTELILRYEYTDIEGDGPASQTHTNGSGVDGFSVNFDRDSHDFSIDEPGFQKVETNFFSAELNIDVAFGDGTITNIFGWRESEIMSLSDIDAQPVWLFHAPAWLNTDQVSNELRYNGLFADDRANVTMGVYYFTNEINYHERRELLGTLTGNAFPALQLDGGGNYDVDTLGVFAAVDYELSDKWTLTAGLRYTREEKAADVASLIRNVNTPCNIVTTKDCPFDFVDSDEWTNVSPKIGATYHVDDDSLVYGHWSQGVRSGGYNLRNTSLANAPEVFDEETVDSFEIGYKTSREWGRLNAAVFYNTIDDMQRELNLPNEGAGVVQLIRNTADATITGLEVDGVFSLTDNLLLLASLGVINPEYDEVREDLNGDGVIDELDKALDLPRAAELTWSLGFNHDLNLGQWGYLSSRINYAYRDRSAYTDSNLGFILEQGILDVGLDFHSNSGRWVFSLYGRNLQGDVKHGGDTQLPDVIGPVGTGGTFSPLAKGRVIGVEVTFRSGGN